MKKKADDTTMVPDTIRNNIGNMLIEKGISDDGLLKLYQWDAVDACVQEDCPAFGRCTAPKKGACTVQLSYVKAMLDLVYRNYDEYITEPLLFKVGLHILPSYKILSKLLIAEMGIVSVTYEDSKGGQHIHPIFKEVREQIKSITALWYDLGLPVHAGQVKASLGKELYAD